MAYSTKSKIENYLQVNIDDSIASFVEDWINWVTRYIDNYTGTTFESATETKYYDTRGTTRLFIDDCISVSSVQFLRYNGSVEASLTENTDYWLYPLNRTTKNEIRLNPYGKYSRFYSGSKRLKVTGNFGVSSSVPPDIEMVATQMVGDIIKQSSGEAKVVTAETLGDRSVTYEKAESFIVPYQKILDLYRCPVL